MKRIVLSTLVFCGLLISSCAKENDYQCVCTEGEGSWSTTYVTGVKAKNREAAIEKCENLRNFDTGKYCEYYKGN